MSGGSLDSSFRVEIIADQISVIIENNEQECGYPKEVISKLQETVNTLKQASAMARLVDRLVSGDETRDSFLLQWEVEIVKANVKID